MATVFMGQIILIAGNYAPRGFLLCQGQVVSIQQYVQLFSIIGTDYGGNGTTNFALPNLVGNLAVGQNAGTPGPGLENQYFLGTTLGSATVTLDGTQLPIHNHPFVAVSDIGTTQDITNNVFATATSGNKSQGYAANFYSPNAANATSALAPDELSTVGGGGPHNNMQPWLAINMCISVAGLPPPRG